jgi:hypothetical protein
MRVLCLWMVSGDQAEGGISREKRPRPANGSESSLRKKGRAL